MINPQRRIQINRSAYFEDLDLVEELKSKIEH